MSIRRGLETALVGVRGGPGRSRYLGIVFGIAVVMCFGEVGTVAAGASSEPSHAARCSGGDIGVTGPVIKYPRVYAVGFFCSPDHRNNKATVVLQGRINGRWKALASVSKQLNMRPGKKYTLTTPPIHCTAHRHYVHMRGHASLLVDPP